MSEWIVSVLYTRWRSGATGWASESGDQKVAGSTPGLGATVKRLWASCSHFRDVHGCGYISAQKGIGKSFNLDPRSWRVWVRRFAFMGFSPIPAGLREPASVIVPTVLCVYCAVCTRSSSAFAARVVRTTFFTTESSTEDRRCRLSEENVYGLLFCMVLK